MSTANKTFWLRYRPVPLPDRGPPDFEGDWPARSWDESRRIYLENEAEIHRQYVHEEYCRRCQWLDLAIKHRRPEWTELEHRTLAERIVERRLRRSKAYEVIPADLSAPERRAVVKWLREALGRFENG